MMRCDSDSEYQQEIRYFQCGQKKAFRKQSYELNDDYNELSKKIAKLRMYNDEYELNTPIKKIKSNELDKQDIQKDNQLTVDFQPPQYEFMQQEDDGQLYFLNDDQDNQGSD